jgi:hypothetical protein
MSFNDLLQLGCHGLDVGAPVGALDDELPVDGRRARSERGVV